MDGLPILVLFHTIICNHICHTRGLFVQAQHAFVQSMVNLVGAEIIIQTGCLPSQCHGVIGERADERTSHKKGARRTLRESARVLSTMWT